MLHLTPALMEATYDLLRMTPPFKRWKLPPGEEIKFLVTCHDDRHGHFTTHVRWKHPRIGMSVVYVKTLQQLTETMAHEMVHLKQWLMDGEKWNDNHDGKQFCRMADQVCRAHRFDRGSF